MSIRLAFSYILSNRVRRSARTIALCSLSCGHNFSPEYMQPAYRLVLIHAYPFVQVRTWPLNYKQHLQNIHTYVHMKYFNRAGGVHSKKGGSSTHL